VNPTSEALAQVAGGRARRCAGRRGRTWGRGRPARVLPGGPGV